MSWGWVYLGVVDGRWSACAPKDKAGVWYTEDGARAALELVKLRVELVASGWKIFKVRNVQNFSIKKDEICTQT